PGLVADRARGVRDRVRGGLPRSRGSRRRAGRAPLPLARLRRSLAPREPRVGRRRLRPRRGTAPSSAGRRPAARDPWGARSSPRVVRRHPRLRARRGALPRWLERPEPRRGAPRRGSGGGPCTVSAQDLAVAPGGPVVARGARRPPAERGAVDLDGPRGPSGGGGLCPPDRQRQRALVVLPRTGAEPRHADDRGARRWVLPTACDPGAAAPLAPRGPQPLALTPHRRERSRGPGSSAAQRSSTAHPLIRSLHLRGPVLARIGPRLGAPIEA